MKRWRVRDSHPVPVEVECEVRGYPHKDSDGEEQFHNTHFDSEDEAWEKAQRSAEAYVAIAGRDVVTAEEILSKARAKAGEAAKFMKEFLDGRRQRERERERSAHDDDGTGG